MSRKVPHAAFVEEYDEDAHIAIPETRQVANIAAKRSNTDLSTALVLTDGASDSGYSSRTAATVNSTQSGPLGRKRAPLKVDTAPKRSGLERVRSNNDDRTKSQAEQPMCDDKVQMGPFPSSGDRTSVQRSPPRRRESVHVRHYPGTCWECDHGLYHLPAPVEQPPSMEYPYYAPHSTHMQGYSLPPLSPRASRHPLPAAPDIQVSYGGRPRARSGRSMSYHAAGRPASFHESMPRMIGAMYSPQPMSSYEHGPPVSSSAWSNQAAYLSHHYSHQPPYFPGPDYPLSTETDRDRSISRSRDRSRRLSLYGPSIDYDASHVYDGVESMEHKPTRASRPRIPSQQSYERDEDFYRMPPPPLKQKPAPQIIQKRPDPLKKSTAVTSAGSERQSNKSFDMSEIEAALPAYRYRRSSRETIIPERSHSTREGRHNAVYYESSRRSRRVDEGGRQNPIYYEPSRRSRDSEDRGRYREVSIPGYPRGEVEEKQREAEEYQAARSGKTAPISLTTDALLKAKKSQRADSDGSSQKSGSNSSRITEARSKPNDDKNIIMSMNGVTMSFTQESIGGKRINVRTGDTGAVELNIGGKRTRKYLPGGTRSDNASSSGRKEMEDYRRAREDRRSDRASRRSSRSTYGTGRFLE